jgi:hypothetical protein
MQVSSQVTVHLESGGSDTGSDLTIRVSRQFIQQLLNSVGPEDKVIREYLNTKRKGWETREYVDLLVG